MDNENKVNVNETCGVFINDVIMEETCDENPIVQTKINRNLKGENEQLMENDIKKLHVQRKTWKPHGRNFIMCVNDNTNVDLENPQIMRCIFYFDSLINATNPRTQSRKGLISYYKTNGITFF